MDTTDENIEKYADGGDLGEFGEFQGEVSGVPLSETQRQRDRSIDRDNSADGDNIPSFTEDVEGGDDKPEDEGGDGKPDDQGGDGKPEDEGGDDKPEDGGGDDKPEDEGGDDKPEDGGGDDKPEDEGGDDHPEDQGSDDHPEDQGSDDHPEDEGGDDQPEEQEPPPNKKNSLTLYFVNNLFFLQKHEDLKLELFKKFWSVGISEAFEYLEKNAVPDTIFIDKELDSLDSITCKRIMYLIESNRDVFPKAGSVNLEKYLYNVFKKLTISDWNCTIISDVPRSGNVSDKAVFSKISKNKVQFEEYLFLINETGWTRTRKIDFLIKETQQAVDYRSENNFIDTDTEITEMTSVLNYLNWAINYKKADMENDVNRAIFEEIKIEYPLFNEPKLNDCLKFVNQL
jgi:hypothetical protein